MQHHDRMAYNWMTEKSGSVSLLISVINTCKKFSLHAIWSSFDCDSGVHSAHEENDTLALIQQWKIQNKTREKQQLRTEK